MAQTSNSQLTYPPEEVDALKMLSINQHKLGHAVEEALEVEEKTTIKKGTLMSNFDTGNQVQLVSKASGRTLRIIQARSGQLKVDSRGDLGGQEWNAVWTVINEGHNQIRLHNNFNFLAIVNGETTVIHVPQGSEHDKPETKLQVIIHPESFVTLESMREPEKCIGILDSGSLKSAENCTCHDDHSMFGVHLIKKA
ncbi:uncharacterized protein LOC134234887 [Saccostrea cucullata]|uniref:uncharacterized protein LOC134234887 n=2 Tax=Saccostrea cuccullata TaxID=36930 RepID=UPI002ED2413E